MDQENSYGRSQEGDREVPFKYYHEYKVAFMNRFGRQCQHCGTEMLDASIDRSRKRVASIDHIVPRAQGGSDRESNLTVCCCSCNTSKGATELETFRQKRGREGQRVTSLLGLWSDDFEASRLRRARERLVGKSTISFEIPYPDYRRLKRRAEREGRSLSNLIRRLAFLEAARLGVTKDGTRPTV